MQKLCEMIIHDTRKYT